MIPTAIPAMLPVFELEAETSEELGEAAAPAIDTTHSKNKAHKTKKSGKIHSQTDTPPRSCHVMQIDSQVDKN